MEVFSESYRGEGGGGEVDIRIQMGSEKSHFNVFSNHEEQSVTRRPSLCVCVFL